MGAKQRVYRQRINSTRSLQKIFRAQELIATSRIAKARARVNASTPYARAITRAVSALATFSNVDHPLLTEKEQVRRAAVLLVTSDRGLAGAYSANAIREAERLSELLRDEGKEVVPYLAGRKGVTYYRFRQRPVQQEWIGHSDSPTYEVARKIGDTLVDAFVRGSENDGVDEIHVVFTRFVNMVTQTPETIRMLPLEVVEGLDEPAPDDVLPLYEFEPNPVEVLDALLPRYVGARIYNCLLQAAASEHAARQRAMKSASDNAEEIIKNYTRLANSARQAEITQEISEIVGGANALAASSN